MIDIDIAVEAGDWPDEDGLNDLASRAIGATLEELGKAVSTACELSLLFTDDDHIAVLNRDWRGKDKPTNVLSFPAFEVVPGDPLPPLLGDIVFASQTVFSEAALEGKPVDHHLTHLVVHGFLHLLGYDHESEKEADEMESLERRVLARLAIPDPYG